MGRDILNEFEYYRENGVESEIAAALLCLADVQHKATGLSIGDEIYRGIKAVFEQESLSISGDLNVNNL